MTVVDASLFVNALISNGAAGVAARAELGRLLVPDTPSVLVAEVTSALRQIVLRGELEATAARTALEQARAAPRRQFSFEPFAGRVWELRNNLSVYDAWYVALAEWLETDLVTADARLATAPGPTCLIRLLA